MNRAVVSHRELTDRERVNFNKGSDYTQINALSEVWAIAADRFGQLTALHDPHHYDDLRLSYHKLWQQIRQFATGLQSLGIQLADEPPRVALFAENSPRWLVADQGIIAAGAANVVRSSQADRDELLYIFQHSQSSGLVVEDLATLDKLRSATDDSLKLNDTLTWVILLSDETPPEEMPFRVLNFTQLMEIGASGDFRSPAVTRETLATLIYTSGTTGRPKGAMLTHGNFLHQINAFRSVFPPEPGDRALSILPSWHAYERTCEYYLLSQGCTLIYTSIRHFKQDLKQHKPHVMVGVPRLWESIYEGVQKTFRQQPPKKQKLANFFIDISERYIEAKHRSQGLSLDATPPSKLQRLKAKAKKAALSPLHRLGSKLVYSKVRAATGGHVKYLISGGGSLARHIDTFFEVIGINLLVGYGLTETSPVLTVRRAWENLQGSSGLPVIDTEICIVNPETREVLPEGETGLVLARGPQIMKGYYRNPEATQKAIDPQGWFDTGDLGRLLPGKYLVLTGRAKDTIVLSNGENIEPQPIEDACVRSAYIDQIMLVGQDRKQLGALIVPNWEALTQWATEQGISVNAEATPPVDIEGDRVKKLFRGELNREVKNRPGYRTDDRIGPFCLILEPFSIENGSMTQTLKIKRPVVRERYRDTIDKMFE
ncbi:AMP-dependent synthetase/ligase [Baaleninema simplex]|uniref:AMP-dependent synthetase/ligase n=1 Tax=Baaleninema simplex TaxID=2862350 RepID=UPI00034C951B|nr:long-chain fatty acid--CoA ligase [Baaleninema simplex]